MEFAQSDLLAVAPFAPLTFQSLSYAIIFLKTYNSIHFISFLWR